LQVRKLLTLIVLLLIPTFSLAVEKADMVLVKKSDSKLFLKKNGKVFKQYHVAFGANPKGHKHQEGDERTPEGRYFLDYKKADSAYYKSIHISYPNETDKKRAKESGVNPGGLIMIHGQKNGFGWLSWITQRFNWTDGCIAVSNRAMDEIWQSVDVGTPIEIRP
jgi:murein L,D-transpeptidase YafK